MKKIVDASRLTTLSSEGFLKFLPKSEKYRIIYSYNMNIIRESNVSEEFKNDGQLIQVLQAMLDLTR